MDDCREQIHSVLSERAAQRLARSPRNLAAEHGLFAVIMLTTWMRHYEISA
jgi:hypothetical protein